MNIQIEFQPVGKKVDVPKGVTILEAARSAGIGLLATCGGQSSCGSCVIQMISNQDTYIPSDTEIAHLTQSELDAGYRLACQTRLFTPAVIDIPPQSLTTPQRLQVEGESTTNDFKPDISVVDLKISSVESQTLHEFREISLNTLKTNRDANATAFDETTIEGAYNTAVQHQGRITAIIHQSIIIAALPPSTPVLGLAIDIGTTKIAGYLVNLRTGDTLSKQGCMNPQVAYGDDVMARITYALSANNGANILQSTLITALNQLSIDLCNSVQSESIKTQPPSDYHPSQIAEMVLVGNTAMHHICTGLPLQQLGHAPYAPAVSEAMKLTSQELNLEMAPGGFVHLLPNIAGFVGADHVSMLLASGIMEESKNTIYIDIGTNTEITLLMDGRMICCSTASGPAFEGAHIKDGMRAAEGAIEQIWISDSQVRYQTINNTPPVGICGSGIIDGIAQMLSSGLINERGALDQEHPLVRKGENGPELVIAPAGSTGHGTDITINRKDISEIQLAKGAIRAGLELLLAETGNEMDRIEKVIIAGAFGSFINIKSAKTIGLFPNLASSRFKQVGNAAGMGARQSLLSRQKRAEATVISDKMEYLELAGHDGFTKAFATAMMFEPEGPLNQSQ